VKVSVIIPHYDDLDNLSVCLDMLDRQTISREEFEIIVADNMSTCGLGAVEAVAAGRARVILAAERGAGPARNTAAAAARTDALAFVDSDCRPAPEWLREGLAALESHPIVGGPVIIEPRDASRISDIEAFDMVFGFDARTYLEKHGFIGSGNLFVRRSVFEQVGGFRKGVAEDVEWSHRAVSHGFSLHHASGAVVGHPARRDWSELVRKWEKQTREGYLLMREKRLGLLRWVGRSWLLPLSPIPHILKVLRSKRLVSSHDRRRAITVLFRIRFYRFREAHRVLLNRSLNEMGKDAGLVSSK
jgi:GT2 family glycosyltransferase